MELQYLQSSKKQENINKDFIIKLNWNIMQLNNMKKLVKKDNDKDTVSHFKDFKQSTQKKLS